MNCTVTRDENGNIQEVLTQSGDRSNLYYDLLFELNDPEEALKAYALTLTSAFNEQMGDVALNEQGEHTIDTYKSYNQQPAIDMGFESFSQYPYLQLKDDEIINQSSTQYANATKQQKDTIDKVIIEHLGIKKKRTGIDTYVYTKVDPYTGNEVDLQGTTTFLDNNPRYKFEGITSDDTKYLDWGNIADDILGGVILGKSFDKIEADLLALTDINVNDRISIKARRQLFDIFTQLYNEQAQQGNILLTQVRIGNTTTKLGGTIDILVVRPDGTLQVLDLKTSVSSFTSPNYKKRYRSADNQYEKASKFDKHSAQVSIYGNILENNGFNMSVEDRLRIVPIHIQTDEQLTPGYAGSVTQEQKYIPANNIQEFNEMFKGVETSANRNTFQRIIATLSNLVESYKKSGQAQTAAALKEFIDSIQGNEYFDGMVKIAEDAYSRFMGKNGLEAQLDALLSRLNDTDNLQEVINDIVKIESVIKLFNPEKGDKPLADLRNALKDQANEPGSIGYKVVELMATIQGMEQKINTQVPAVLAKYLSQNIPTDASDNIIKMLDAKQAELKRAKARLQQATSDRQKDRRAKKVKELQNALDDFVDRFQIDKTKRQPDFEAMVEREIRDGAYRDISIVDRWVGSAINMPVGFLSLYALKVKEAFTRVSQEAVDILYKSNQVFTEFTKGISLISTPPEKLNEGLYTTVKLHSKSEEGVTSKEVLSFVSPYDYNSFYQARADMYDAAYKTQNPRQTIAKWYTENTQARPQDDYVVNGVVIIEGINSIFKRKREELGEDSREYKIWESANKIERKGKITYTNELAIPADKYRSSEFEALLKDDRKLKIYTHLLDMYFEAQALQPDRADNDFGGSKFIAPGVPKSSMDRLTENGVKNLAKYKFNDLFKVIDEDINEVNYDESNKSVNILYYNTSSPLSAEDTTKDLMSSVLRYSIAAKRYKARKELAGIGSLLHSRVSQTQPQAVTPKGNTISYKHLKGKVESFLTKKSKTGNNAADMLESFINMQIYGMTKAKNETIFGIDANKLADSLAGFGAFTQLGFDATLSVANSLVANITNAMEAAGGRHYGLKEWKDAALIYANAEVDLIKDSWSPVKTSFIGQLAQLYDAMQGEFVDEYGTKLTKSTLKDKWYKKAAFSGMHKGEHRAQVTSLIAMLKRTKVKQVINGKEQTISLYEAYHIPEGKTQIELKPGVVLNNQVGKIDIGVQNKLHSINTQLHGIYNNFEAPELSRHWIGRLMLMYRKFLPAGLKYRYKNEGYNFALNDFTRGTYIDFYKNLFTEPKRILEALKKGETTLSPWEKANLRKALFEHAIIIVTGALVLALQRSLDDDDENRELTQWALYSALRLNIELSTFGAGLNPRTYMAPNPGALLYSFNQVSVISSVIGKGMKLQKTLMQDLFAAIGVGDYALYERDSGLFKRGDSKSFANFVKLVGINNRKLFQNPEEAVNILLLER